MNRLYYSTYCSHCRELLNFLKENHLLQSLDFICVDDRFQDPTTGLFSVLSEDKKRYLPVPPNIQQVPALLLVNSKYEVLFGKQINAYFSKSTSARINENLHPPDEPTPLGNEDLSLMSYSLSGSSNPHSTISTPPDTYKPYKIGDVDIDTMAKKREKDIYISDPTATNTDYKFLTPI